MRIGFEYRFEALECCTPMALHSDIHQLGNVFDKCMGRIFTFSSTPKADNDFYNPLQSFLNFVMNIVKNARIITPVDLPNILYRDITSES